MRRTISSLLFLGVAAHAQVNPNQLRTTNLPAAGTVLTANGPNSFSWSAGGTGSITGAIINVPVRQTVTSSTSGGVVTNTISDNPQAANLVFAGPASGSALTPSFRALTPTDISSLFQGPITTGHCLQASFTSGAVTIADAGTACGSSGGGAGNPAGPAYAINFANSGVTGFQADQNFTINPGTHVLSASSLALTTNAGAFESAERVLVDPANPAYLGGLAAAVAGTSGNTPTQVIQKAIDTAECAFQGGTGPANIRVVVPANLGTIALSGVKLWSNMEFGGMSNTDRPAFQHSDSSQAMITGHLAGDTLTCTSNTYTPGVATNVTVGFFQISGMGPVSTHTDQGVKSVAANWNIHDIGGFGNGFGAQAILDAGFEDKTWNLGLPGQQLKGCMSYTSGTMPVSGAANGYCYAIESIALDSRNATWYGTDGTQALTNHTTSSCYPYCGGIGLMGDNAENADMFGQISTVGITVNGLSTKNWGFRSDGSSREGILLAPAGFGGSTGNGTSGSTFTGMHVNSACTDTALNVATATGCFDLHNVGQGNTITGFVLGGSAPTFGASYDQAMIGDDGAGASASPNNYAQVAYVGGPTNTSPNHQLAGGAGWQGDHASASIALPSSAAATVSGQSTVNVSGITEITLGDATPVSFVGGIPGQKLWVHGGVVQQNARQGSCTGGNEGTTLSEWDQVGQLGYNYWAEVCNTPQAYYAHLNEVGNGTPTNLSIVDAYGSMQTRQIPAVSSAVFAGAIQLYGPSLPAGGQICYEQENDFADGTKSTTPVSCSPTDIVNATGGEIFVSSLIQQSGVKLYITSVPSGYSVNPGLIAAPAAGSNWPYTQLKTGGDNTNFAPPASLNSTGTYFAPQGVTLNTTGTQPTCSADYAERLWYIPATSSADAQVQICRQAYTGGYTWLAFGGSGGGGGITGLTTGSVPVAASPTSLGNSPIDVNVTTASTVTSTETIAAPTFNVTGSGAPIITATAPVQVAAGITSLPTPTNSSDAATKNYVDTHAGGSPAFNNLTTGTNTSATMTVGTGSTLTYSGTGTNNASSLGGVAASSITPVASSFAAHRWYGNNTGSAASASASLIGTSDYSPNIYIAGGGTAQAQTVTLIPAATALTAGLEVRWKPTAANTAAAPTLAVNGLAATPITKLGTAALIAGDLTTTAIADAIYDGTEFQLQNPQTAASGGQVYPGAGIPNSTGSSYGTSYTTSGSGTVVALTNSPTLVAPNLGTPSAAVLTNATGLPLSTGVTGVLPVAQGGNPTGTSGQTIYYAGTTPTATSAITESVSGAPIGLNGQVYQVSGGPTSLQSWNGACSSTATTCTVYPNTTGLPTTGGYLLATSGGGGTNEILYYAGVSGSTITGLVRGQWGTTAQNLGNGANFSFINYAQLTSTSALPLQLATSNGPIYALPTANSFNLTGATNTQPFVIAGGSGYFSSGYSLGTNGVIEQMTVQASSTVGLQNASGTNTWASDTTGQTGVSAGTLAVLSTTTSVTPNSGFQVLTGTAPTSGTLVTMVAQNACTVTGIACNVTVLNTTSGTITTGTSGNFNAAYSFAVGIPASCWYYQSNSKWYCHV